MSLSDPSNSNIDWKKLVESIRNHECILVLGPKVITVEKDGHSFTLPDLLTIHLKQQLLAANPSIQLAENPDLAYVAKQLEDSFLPRYNFSREKARSKLGEIISKFYEQYSHEDFPVFQQLAKLPLRFIVNTNPHLYMGEAYDDENKFGAVTEYYHYGNPTHNSKVNIDVDQINIDSPLIYNLFGTIENPESMIVTESDQLAFLDAILQREKTATIPPSIAIHFTSVEKETFDKTFVFLGFDFNQWHLRLLMHMINRYQKQKETYALQSPQSLTDLTSFFYKRNFEVQFVDIPPDQFVEAFQTKISTLEETKIESPNLNVFLMYDTADDAAKDALDLQLSPLKRNEMIQTWDEEQIQLGEVIETAVENQLQKADIIILLVTAAFFASDAIYEKQLRQALARHEQKQTVVIPILMKSCAWESSIISSLTTVLPRNKIPLSAQENETAGMADTIKQLEGFCHKIFKRKMRNIK